MPQQPSPSPRTDKLIRAPFSSTFQSCTCGVDDKDDCACIRRTARSNSAKQAGLNAFLTSPEHLAALAKWRSEIAELRKVLDSGVNAPASFVSRPQRGRRLARAWLNALPAPDRPSVDWQKIASAEYLAPISLHQAAQRWLKRQAQALRLAIQSVQQQFAEKSHPYSSHSIRVKKVGEQHNTGVES